jgi:hypothetical protein
MSRLLLLVGGFAAGLAFLLLGACFGPGAEEMNSADRLVAQLGSDNFQEREQAGEALEALGEAALPALRRALRHPDPEVRRHAGELAQRLERRLDSRRLLTPRRLRLVVKDLPVPDAVAELSRVAGAPIHLRGSQERLRERRVTLDTGDTTFWDALARLCREAGLRECPTLPLQAAPAEEGGRDGIVVVDTSVFAQSPGSDGPFALEEGAPPELPATQVGALSIRALPPAGSPLRFPDSGAWLRVTLEVKPEPAIDWQSLVSLRLDRAVDEHGQVLRPGPAFVAGAFRPARFVERGFLIAENGLALPVNAGLRQVSLPLEAGPLPARCLKELHGTLAARIRPPVETLVTAEDLMQARGRRFTGPDGTMLKVSEVTADDAGGYDIKVGVAEAPRVLDFDVPSVRVLNLNRNNVGPDLLSPAERTSLFTARDANGKPLLLATASRAPSQDRSLQLYNLVFQAGRGQGPPVRLAYHGRRTALIEVPFVLRNVPLLPEAR